MCKRILLTNCLLAGLLMSQSAWSDTLDCRDLYVGSVTVDNGVIQAVFKNAKDNASGSYAQNFAGWSEEYKKAALSVLLAAKMAGHRVNVWTTQSSGCDIQTGGRVLKTIQLANNP